MEMSLAEEAEQEGHVAPMQAGCIYVYNNHNNNLQAFQLIVLARYLPGVPNPSPVSQHALP